MIKFEVYTKRGEFVDGFKMNPFAALYAIINYRRKGYVVVIVWNVEDLNGNNRGWFFTDLFYSLKYIMKSYNQYKKELKVIEFIESNGMDYIILDLEGWYVVKDNGLFVLPIDKRHINRTSLGNVIYLLTMKGFRFIADPICCNEKKSIYFRLEENEFEEYGKHNGENSHPDPSLFLRE